MLQSKGQVLVDKMQKNKQKTYQCL